MLGSRPRLSIKESSALQVVDLALYILKETEQDHILDTCSHQRNGESFVHAGSGYRYSSLANFLRLSEEDALSTSLAGIKGVSLQEERVSFPFLPDSRP